MLALCGNQSPSDEGVLAIQVGAGSRNPAAGFAYDSSSEGGVVQRSANPRRRAHNPKSIQG